MNVDPVGFLPPAAPIAGMQDAGAITGMQDTGASAGIGDFSSWLAKEIGSVSSKVAQSDTMLQRLATGEVDNLHQVMIALEDAKISFQLLVAVRNKLLDAYQDILRMQV